MCALGYAHLAILPFVNAIKHLICMVKEVFHPQNQCFCCVSRVLTNVKLHSEHTLLYTFGIKRARYRTNNPYLNAKTGSPSPKTVLLREMCTVGYAHYAILRFVIAKTQFVIAKTTLVSLKNMLLL
jgi:hypothetical protein